MKITYRATDDFMAQVRRDLVRPHPFAYERVGFISVRATAAQDDLVLLAEDYHPVADQDYVRDPSVGAMLGQEALRKALELALLRPIGMLHVHMHELPGRLWFSYIDLREQHRFVPDFFKVRPKMPHGALVLSPSTVAGRVWLDPNRVIHITEFNSVGRQMKVSQPAEDGSVDFYA